MISLEKTGCLLKFLDDLDDATCRDDLHFLSPHCEGIKWTDFIKGAKEGNNSIS